MMKKCIGVVMVAGIMLLIAGNASAMSGLPPDDERAYSDYKEYVYRKYENKVRPVRVSAPEIDMRSGGGAIALLITVVLIAAERGRRT